MTRSHHEQTLMLEARVRAYRVLRARGEHDSVTHDDLYAQIRAFHGPAAAEFFNDHAMLPYVTGPLLPWPMRSSEARSYELARFVATSMAAVIVCFTLLPAVGVFAAAGAGFLAAVGTFGLLASPAARLGRPDDLDSRLAYVNVYNEIKAEHEMLTADAEARERHRQQRGVTGEG